MKIDEFKYLESKGFVSIGKTHKHAPIYFNGNQLLICTDLMKETYKLFDVSNKRGLNNVMEL